MINLTRKEKAEVIWFLKTVQSWYIGGPYGDGENILEKKRYSLMNKIIAKLEHD